MSGNRNRERIEASLMEARRDLEEQVWKRMGAGSHYDPERVWSQATMAIEHIERRIARLEAQLQREQGVE